MRNFHAVMTLKHKSGFVEDDVVNTFNILSDADDAFIDWGEITLPLFAFYNADSPVPTNAIGFNLGSGLSRAAGDMRLRIYDVTDHLDGSPHGSPVAEDFGTLVAPTENSTMVEEAALCLTMRAGGWADLPVEVPDGADPGVAIDRPLQRGTGRIYLGPWTNASFTVGADFKNRPRQTLIDSILGSAVHLQNSLEVNNHLLSVWSRKNEVFQPLDGPGYDPGAFFVDNAWDTQRRRGPAPTVRTQVAV